MEAYDILPTPSLIEIVTYKVKLNSVAYIKIKELRKNKKSIIDFDNSDI